MLEVNGKYFVIVMVKIFKTAVNMKKKMDKKINHFTHKKESL